MTVSPTKCTARKPWDYASEWPVPWTMRTYCFDVDMGIVKVLYEEWQIQRDDAGSVRGCHAKPGSKQNPGNMPELDHALVNALFDYSAKNGVPLKNAFLKTYQRSELSPKHLERLARANSVYAESLEEARVVERVATEKAVADFLAEVDGETDRAAKRSLRPATAGT